MELEETALLALQQNAKCQRRCVLLLFDAFHHSVEFLPPFYICCSLCCKV